MSKIRAGLLALLALAIAPMFVQAQDVPAWPPDPETIFAPGVEVVGVKTVENAPSNPTYDFEPYVDNETRKVYIYDDSAQVWNAFPFPDIDVYVNYKLKTRSDGLITVHGYPYDSDVWLLNPQTGEFSKPETICGMIRSAPGEGRWVVVPQESGASEYRLCFTETGEVTDSLPLIEKDSGQQWQVAGTSFDQDWVVLQDHPSCRSAYYGYQISTKTLNYLGALDTPSDQCSVEFQDDTFFLIFIDNMPEWSERSLMIGDVTIPNSLHVILSNIRLGPVYYDNPPRYELIPGVSGEGHGWRGWNNLGPNCVLQIYDLGTRQIEEYELGNVCTPNLIVPNDYHIRYFRYVSLDVNEPATLIRYDLRTRQRTDLFTGEIENVVGTSPDGRYVVLLMDTNGSINLVPDVFDQAFFVTGMLSDKTYWAVYDTEQQKVIYQLNGRLINSDGTASTTWYSSNLFALSQIHGGSGNDYIRWIWLDTGTVIATDEVMTQQNSPDGQNIVLKMDNSFDDFRVTKCQIKVLNLAARELIPVTNEFENGCSSVNITAQWQNNENLILTLKQNREDSGAIQYTVRVPDQ